jgi:hypothetical protein
MIPIVCKSISTKCFSQNAALALSALAIVHGHDANRVCA